MSISIGDQLRAVRSHRRLSQYALGQRAGLRQERVSVIERGVPATADEASRLAAALNVSVEALTDSSVLEAFAAVVERYAAGSEPVTADQRAEECQ